MWLPIFNFNKNYMMLHFVDELSNLFYGFVATASTSTDYNLVVRASTADDSFVMWVTESVFAHYRRAKSEQTPFTCYKKY